MKAESMWRLVLGFFLFLSPLFAEDIKEYDPLYKIEDGQVFHFQKLGRNVICGLAYIYVPEKKTTDEMIKFMDYCKEQHVKNVIMAGTLARWHIEDFFQTGKKYMYNTIEDENHKTRCIIHISSQYNLSEKVVEDGFAMPVFSKIPEDDHELYVAALEQARMSRAGLWSGYPNMMQCLQEYVNPDGIPEIKKKAKEKKKSVE